MSIGLIVTIILIVVRFLLPEPMRLQYRWAFLCGYSAFGGMLYVAMMGLRGRDLTKDLYPVRLAAALAIAGGCILLMLCYHEVANILGVPASQHPYFRVATFIILIGLPSFKPLIRWLFASPPG